MSEARATRRLRGIVQNVANQLVQMAVGWQAMFDGPALLAEPDVGVMEIDAALGTGTINAKPADLFMAAYLNEWLTAELTRAGLKPSHVLSAAVRVEYQRQSTEQKDSGHLRANSHVVFTFGEARGSFSNTQTLLRYIYTPGDRWKSSMRQPTIPSGGTEDPSAQRSC
jgi:hypothetical protein